MKPEFENIVRAELEPGEEALWEGRADALVLRGTLVASTVLWMSGLFMFGAGVLRSAPDDSHALFGLIFILVIIAAAGSVEVILVPRRANQTIYLITDRRVLSLCAVKRLKDGEENLSSSPQKTLHKQTKNSPTFFLLTNLPAQIFFLILARDVITSFAKSFDVFMAVGFTLTAIAWILPWFQDLRLPIPRFRDVPRTFYEVGEYFVFSESVLLSDILYACYRRSLKGTVNCFVVSRNDGCMRLRAIADAESVKELLSRKQV